MLRLRGCRKVERAGDKGGDSTVHLHSGHTGGVFLRLQCFTGFLNSAKTIGLDLNGRTLPSSPRLNGRISPKGIMQFPILIRYKTRCQLKWWVF